MVNLYFLEGRLSLGTYTARDGTQKTGLQMACHGLERPTIGNRKPKREKTGQPAKADEPPTGFYDERNFKI